MAKITVFSSDLHRRLRLARERLQIQTPEDEENEPKNTEEAKREFLRAINDLFRLEYIDWDKVKQDQDLRDEEDKEPE